MNKHHNFLKSCCACGRLWEKRKFPELGPLALLQIQSGSIKKLFFIRKNGPYVLSGGPLIFNVILFKRKAVYTEGAGPVCKCTGQCTLEGSILLF